MRNVTVDGALWRSRILPEGIVERWLVSDGTRVPAGAPVAVLRIEDALHEIMAPESGVLAIVARPNSVIEPGSVLAELK